MGNPVMKREYPDQKQRTAVCFNQWRKKGTKGVRGGDRGGSRQRPLKPLQFEPPQAGTAPQGVKDILRKVYTSCRKNTFPGESAEAKTRCSKIAWSAVEKAGWHKVDDKWKKRSKAKMTRERTFFNVELMDRCDCHEIRIMPLKKFDGVYVAYCITPDKTQVQSLQFSKSSWDEPKIISFLRIYGKQVLSYESSTLKDIYSSEYMQTALDMLVGKETRKLHYVDLKAKINLSKNFKMPYEFEFTALAEGKFNGVYYSASEIEKAYQSLNGKPITIDHSKSVSDIVGKVTEVTFDAEGKRVKAKGFITDENIARKIHDGLLNGMSSEIRVEYTKSEHGLTASDAEFEAISIVQHPACPECTITPN